MHLAMFQVLGRPLRVRIRSQRLEAWVRQFWHRPERAVARFPFALALAEHEVASAVLEGHPTNALLLDFDVPFTIIQTAAEYREGDSGLRLDLSDRGASIRCWGIPHGAPSTRSDRFWGALHVAIHEALRASGLLPVHAAAVVRDGRAVALAGPSGAGKSTTLLRAVRSGGWAVLAEDLSWLDPKNLVLYGWDSGLRLWPDTIERFAPDLATRTPCTDARGKRFFPWGVVNAPFRPTARLDTILLLTRGDSADPPVPSREALKILWEATGVPLVPAVRQQVAAALPTLLDRVRFARHKLGQPLPLST